MISVGYVKNNVYLCNDMYIMNEMRKILFFVFLLFSCLLFANPITNVRAMQEGQKIVLLYDLESTAYVADVEIRIDGKSRVVPLATLSGDVNREVMAGKDRRIEYDVLVDYVDGLRSDNISFVINISGTNIFGAQAVDLGLSVKWASCNVGATKPEEYGDYFAWGETKPKKVYSWDTYKYCNGTYNTLTKYNGKSDFGRVDYKKTLDAQDDAATVNWGGAWRMPTKAEQDELREKCKWVWTTLNGVEGYKVIGPNGNSIFLPAAGCKREGGVYSLASGGNYWSNSLYASFYVDDFNKAYDLTFGSFGMGAADSSNRYCGKSVRPVCK